MSVKLTTRQYGDVTVVDCEGKLTLGEGTTTFCDAVNRLILSGRSDKILLKVTWIKYMDGSGLQQIIQSYTLAKNIGVDLKMCCLSNQIKDSTHYAKLLTVFEEIPDEESLALRSFA